MTPANGLKALLALRSPNGRYKLREICGFLNQQLKIEVSISQLSKIENFKKYKKPCPPLVSIGLIIMHNERMPSHIGDIQLPAGKISICCDTVLEKAPCGCCGGKKVPVRFDVDAKLKALRRKGK